MQWFLSLCCWFMNGYCVGAMLCFFKLLLFRYVDGISLGECGYLMGEYFVLDACGIILGLLTLLVCFVLFLLGVYSFYIYVSIFFAIICYMSTKVFVFWFSYELSILCALFMLVKESPYPERYVASWYFMGYMVLGSGPLLASLILLCLFEGSSNFNNWSLLEYDSKCLVWLICMMFLSKVPVPPFHMWLPLVHAEASSPTSMILSGYIMKLGVLGMMRFGWSVLSSDLMVNFLLLMCMFGLFFMFSSYMECDAKRWLAMLSLFHMLVSVMLCVYGEAGYEVASLYYCFGHGLAVMMAFMMIWWGYNFIGSREWGLLSNVLGGVLLVQMLLGGVFFCVAGFPPTPQFMCELLGLISVTSAWDIIMMLVLSLYLFGGSLMVFMVYGGIVCSVGISGSCWRSGYDNFLLCLLSMTIFGLLLVFFI